MSGTGRQPAITYLCLQAMQEGQASYAHVNGIVGGLRWLGWSVQLHAVPHASRSGFARAVAMLKAQLRCLPSLPGADALYSRWHFAALPTLLVARALRIPIVVEVNGTFEDAVVAWPALRPVGGLIRASSRVQLRWASAIITVTKQQAEWVEAYSARGVRISVVPNAADTDIFTPSRIDAGGGDRVVFVGALAPWQGVDVMIAATRDPAWPDGITLEVAGDGALEAACRRADDGHRFRYLGRVPHAEVPALLRESLASLSVQTGEGGRGSVGCSPLKVYEGLASGRPVISSDIPGVGEVVEAAGAGIVVPAGDAPALARAVATLASDPSVASAMGARGREAAVKLHSWRARAELTARLIDDAASRSDRRRGEIQHASDRPS